MKEEVSEVKNTNKIVMAPNSSPNAVSDTKPAIKIENSPRGRKIINAVAKEPLGRFLTAIYAVSTLATIPTNEISKAGKMAAGRAAGLILSPKNRKNKAAKRSLSGASLSLATRAKSPVRSKPNKNAATAPEKPRREDRPATSKAPPNTKSSKVAESPKITEFLER